MLQLHQMGQIQFGLWLEWLNENVTLLTSYPYQINIYRPGSCVAPVSFTGTIQVAPNPTIDKDFIQAK